MIIWSSLKTSWTTATVGDGMNVTNAVLITISGIYAGNAVTVTVRMNHEKYKGGKNKMNEESNSIKHAKREFQAAGWCDSTGKFEDGPQKSICDNILELLRVFSNRGHTGTTAYYVIDLFEKLAKFKTLTPLTGKDLEWADPGCGDSLQNNRESALFKEKETGKAYYIDAVIFREDDGSCFTGSSELKNGSSICSRQYVKSFPFTPKTFYVDVVSTRWADKEETTKDENGDWWTHIVKDESQLIAVFEYYDKTK